MEAQPFCYLQAGGTLRTSPLICCPPACIYIFPQSLIVKLFQTSPQAALDVCSIQGGSVQGGVPKCPDADPPSDVSCRLVTNLPAVRPPPRPAATAAVPRISQQSSPTQRHQQRGRRVRSWVGLSVRGHSHHQQQGEFCCCRAAARGMEAGRGTPAQLRPC